MYSSIHEYFYMEFDGMIIHFIDPFLTYFIERIISNFNIRDVYNGKGGYLLMVYDGVDIPARRMTISTCFVQRYHTIS